MRKASRYFEFFLAFHVAVGLISFTATQQITNNFTLTTIHYIFIFSNVFVCLPQFYGAYHNILITRHWSNMVGGLLGIFLILSFVKMKAFGMVSLNITSVFLNLLCAYHTNFLMLKKNKNEPNLGWFDRIITISFYKIGNDNHSNKKN